MTGNQRAEAASSAEVKIRAGARRVRKENEAHREVGNMAASMADRTQTRPRGGGNGGIPGSRRERVGDVKTFQERVADTRGD